MKMWKKTLAVVVAFVIALPTVYFGGNSAKEVQATESVEATGVVENTDYVAIEYDQVDVGTATTDIPTAKSSEYADWLFAGWFTGEGCSIESALDTTDVPDANCYAKFVPKDILDVKVQTASESVQEDSVTAGNGAIRFISSVDSLDYSQVGFHITYPDGSTKSYTTNTVYENIESNVTNTTTGEKMTYEFSPKVVDTESEYFITAKLAVTSAEADYTVQAFWTTLDGKTVYGESRCVCANDGKSDTPVSLSFENISEQTIAKNDTLSVTYGDSKTGSAKVVDVNGTTVYVRITLAEGETKDSLPSATKFTFGEAGSAIYRNLYTEYNGSNADRTWFDVYNGLGDTEYIIASSADFYGLADIVNAETDAVTFEGKTIYLAADIDANDVDAVAWSTGTVNAEETKYDWTPIGAFIGDPGKSGSNFESNRSFRGTFDGDGHIINGIYLDSSSCGGYGGIFGYAVNCVLKNFELQNSYYTGSKTLATILGDGDGTLSHIKCSDSVYVNTTTTIVGGMIGRIRDYSKAGGTDGGNATTSCYISDCWFDGNITVSHSSANNVRVGGVVGYKTHGLAELNDVLFTGSINATLTNTSKTLYVGGLFANQNGSNYGSLTIKDSISAGQIVTSATKQKVGLIHDGTGTQTYTNVYGVKSAGCTMATGLSETYTGITVKEDSSTLYAQNGTDLGFENALYWETRTSDVPALKYFENRSSIAEDYEWLYESAGEETDPFMLSNIKELVAFETLVNDEDYTFAGNTVALANSITANKGIINPDAFNSTSEWENFAETLNQWTPIGSRGGYSASYVGESFGGIFDGNGYTISGLYMEAPAIYSGLFGFTQDCTIKNLRLTNGYFTTSYAALGSISGGGDGIFENIYSDIHLNSTNAIVGGILGRVGDTASPSTVNTTLSECWYAGDITQTYEGEFTTGGLIGFVIFGYIAGDSEYQNVIQNSLFTGTITNEYTGTSTTARMRVGGLCGGNNGGTNSDLFIKNSVSAGEISITNSTGIQIGSVVGKAGGSGDTSASKNVMTCTNVYASDSYELSVAGDGFTWTTTSDINFSSNDEIAAALTALNGTEFPVWMINEDATEDKYKLVPIAFSSEKPLLAYYDADMSYESGQGGLAIYVPTDRGYVNYNFVHTVDTDKNADMWRLSVTNLVDDNGELVKQITKEGAEWEMAIWLAGRDDFIGGYAHGDEIYTNLSVALDGTAKEITSLTSYIRFDEMKIEVDSEGFDPADATSKALDHHKEYVINNNGITLNQSVTWANAYTLRNKSYLAMMPPFKYTEPDTEDFITDAYYTDKNPQAVTLRKDSFSIWTEDISSVTVFGAGSGIYFTMTESASSSTYADAHSMGLSDNSGSNYNKMYFAFAGADAVQAGDVWTATTGYNIEWK